MKTIKLYCKKCGVALTDDLLEISESEVLWRDDANFIIKNSFIVDDTSPKKNILVAIDKYYLKVNAKNRDEGCCGNSNEESFNKICTNGHEVATEISDCWSGLYIVFDRNKIVVKEL